jgi:DNA-binding response OmpR family regulator
MSAASWRPTALARRPAHDPPRILVAEDDPEMLDILVQILAADGYEVVGANDGGRMLVQLTRGPKCGYEDVDLIISDIRMPICSGLQILETLRVAHCAVPMILMTGFADPHTRMRAQSLGAVLFNKPFGLDDLRSTVVELLARRREDAHTLPPIDRDA